MSVLRSGIVNKIRYSAEAIQDLEQIGDYIAEILKSPMVALNTVNKIQDTIDKLANFPLIGSPLSNVVNMTTDYRYIVCGNYLVFYRTKTEVVFIDRVLFGRRDYLKILFSDMQGDDRV